MMRFICQKCLRLWDGEQVSHTASCPYCGGGLNARDTLGPPDRRAVALTHPTIPAVTRPGGPSRAVY